MDFEKILHKCGDFHRYQFLLLAIFGSLNFFTSMHYFAQTIVSFVPEHWCYHEKLENRTINEIRDLYAKFENPSCTRLDDIILNFQNSSTSTNPIEEVLVLSEEKCDKWIYNYDYGYRSINTELNWVCDSAYKSSLGQSWFFIGSVVGTLLYGLLSDKYGRLPLLVISNLSAFIGDFSTIFTTNVITFSICRFISGMAADSNACLMYIIVLEYIRPSMRILCLNLGIGIFYCLGLTTTPWIAVLLGHWQYYLLFTSIPLLLIIVVYFIISESAQWLVTNNDIDGAILRLKKISKFNGKNVTDDDFAKFRQFCNKINESTDQNHHSNVFDLFKTPRLRRKTIILFYLAMITTLCYNSVARNVEGIGLSPFIIFSISSATLLPSGLALSFLQNKIGRKGMSSISMLFCGLVTFASGIFTMFEATNTVQMNIIMLSTLQILARFGVAMSYEAGSQYAADLIPTCVRGQGVAAMHVSGSAMSFLSAPLLYLATYYAALPSFILAVLFLSGAFLSIFLPETLNKALAKTMKDGEEFGKNDKLLSFACLANSKTRKLSRNLRGSIGSIDQNLIQRKNLEDFAIITNANHSDKCLTNNNDIKVDPVQQKLLHSYNFN